MNSFVDSKKEGCYTLAKFYSKIAAYLRAEYNIRNLGASPQLEWWNAGIMEKWVLAYGSERILQYWVNGRIRLDDKV